MAFHERMYKCHMVLGNPEVAPVWQWELWQVFTSIFDPIIGLARDKALVRSGQFYKGSRKVVKFGRLGWSARHHERWVHESPTTKDKSQEWDFFFAEASAPSLPQCSRERTPPDVFLVISNEGHLTKSIPLQFNPTVFLAIGEDVASHAENEIQGAIQQLSTLLEAKLVATRIRPWGYSAGSVYSHAIQDIAFSGLFKAGEPHSRPLDLETFHEPWQILKSTE